MNQKPQLLEVLPLPANSGFCYPSQEMQKRVNLEDSALSVMTDLCQVSAITILAEASVDAANHKMIQMGISLLFVVDLQNHVIGVITARDILGDKTQKFLEETGISSSEMCVIDIMTPLEDIETLNIDEVNKAQVGDIILTLETLQRHHILVTEFKKENIHIRGIFSSMQIRKQLVQ